MSRRDNSAHRIPLAAHLNDALALEGFRAVRKLASDADEIGGILEGHGRDFFENADGLDFGFSERLIFAASIAALAGAVPASSISTPIATKAGPVPPLQRFWLDNHDDLQD